MRIATTNKLVTAATISSSSPVTDWPESYLRFPNQQLLGVRSAASGIVWDIDIDFGVATDCDAYGVLNTNFVQAQVWADDNPTFNSSGGNPDFNSGTFSIPRNPHNERRSWTFRPRTTWTKRYHRLRVLAQVPDDGAAFYSLGVFFPCVLPEVPGVPGVPAVRWDVTFEKIEPSDRVGPSGDAWSELLELGDPYTKAVFHRVAEAARGSIYIPDPAGSDEWSQWAELDRQWRLSGYALVMLRDDAPALSWIMRREPGTKWDIEYLMAEGELSTEEVFA